MSGHRSHLKQKNKPHKSGHSAKQQYKVISKNLPGAKVVDPKGQKDRRMQTNDAKRQAKIDQAALIKTIGTKNGPPKIFGVLKCSESADPEYFINQLHFEPEVEGFVYPSGTISSGNFSHRVIPLAMNNSLESLLDMGSVVDVVVLLFESGEPLSNDGQNAITILKGLGLPTCMAVIFSSNGAEIKQSLIPEYRRYIQKDLPDLDRIIPVYNEAGIGQFIRFLSVASPRNISWKENRPTMLIQNYIVNAPAKQVTIQGYLRNAPLSINQIITIPNVGDFQFHSVNDKIPATNLRHEIIYENDAEADVINDEIRPPQTINVPDPVEPLHMSDARPNLEEEEDMGEEDFQENYQEDYPFENEEDDNVDITVWERKEDELEFPNEFEYDNTVNLRQRLIKYRSLKSFVRSPWNPNENLPPQYSKIFEFPAFVRTSETAIAEQAEGEILPGTQVSAVLNTEEDTEIFQRIPVGRVMTMYGLFRHETRFTVLNCTINNTTEIPLESKKDELLMVCGFRHLWIRPIYSEDTRCDKHRYMKYIKKGDAAIATFIAPAVMQTAPILYFRNTPEGIEYTGNGSIKTVDPSRMVIRERILTGNPYRANGKTARVSMMFFNKEDVEWFRTVPLRTKNKQNGHITATVGTKGKFKAIFNEIVDQADTVYMSLYKRVFPPLCDGSDGKPPAPCPARF